MAIAKSNSREFKSLKEAIETFIKKCADTGRFNGIFDLPSEYKMSTIKAVSDDLKKSGYIVVDTCKFLVIGWS